MDICREDNKVRAIVDMISTIALTLLSSLKNCQENDQGQTKREMNGLRPKGHAGTTDHPGGCPGQNILKNSGHCPHLVGKGEEEERPN